MDLNQLIVDLEEIKTAISEDPERAEDLLGFIIGEITIAANKGKEVEHVHNFKNSNYCSICGEIVFLTTH